MTIRIHATRVASALLLLAGFAAAPLTPAVASLSVPASTSRMSSAAIRAHDVDETVRWYRDVLGFRVLADRTLVAGRSVVMERRGMLLEVAENTEHTELRAAAVRDPETTAGTAGPSVSLLVDDVDREVERLRSRGVAIFSEPDDDLEGRFRTAWIADQGRRIVELREPLSGGTGVAP